MIDHDASRIIPGFAPSLLLALFLVATAQPAAAEKGGVVAIGGSVTEIIYALGEEDQLIARDTTSTFPEAASALPNVGYIRALSPEGVLATNPSKIVTLEGAGPPETLEVLRKSSVPIFIIPEKYTADGIVEKILAVGEAIGATEKAKDLASQVSDDVSSARKAAQASGHSPSVLFVLSLSGGRIMAAGAETSAAGIIELAGGKNAITDISGYKQLSDEAVITAAPDVILMMDRTGNHALRGVDLLAHPALATTPAAVNGKIVEMGGLYLLGFGPRTANAIKDLSAALFADDR